MGSQKKFHDVDPYVNFKFQRGRREKVDIIMKQKARQLLNILTTNFVSILFSFTKRKTARKFTVALEIHKNILANDFMMFFMFLKFFLLKLYPLNNFLFKVVM